MDELILNILSESVSVKKSAVKNNLEDIKTGARRIADCIAKGQKILIFGNGGSAADAQHIAAEFVNRFMIERPPLAAVALTTDAASTIGCVNEIMVVSPVPSSRAITSWYSSILSGRCG